MNHDAYTRRKNANNMSESYFNPEDLKKFKDITEFQEELGTKFFDYYPPIGFIFGQLGQGY